MDRSTLFVTKCCIPCCKNTSTKSRDKVFVHVNEAVKKRWAQEHNIELNPQKRLYCCEDHLNLQEDLENYQYWKTMKGRPTLKINAKLRLQYIPKRPGKIKHIQSGDTRLSSSTRLSTLNTLEQQPTEDTIDIKKENVDSNANVTDSNENETEHPKIETVYIVKSEPMTSDAYPGKIDAATQCVVEVMDQSTSTDIPDKSILITQPSSITCDTPSSQTNSHSSSGSSSILKPPSTSSISCDNTSSPTNSHSSSILISPSTSSISCDITSRSTNTTLRQTESTSVESQNAPELTFRTQMLKFINSNPETYIGMAKDKMWLLKVIVTNSKTPISELDLYITLFKIKLNDPAVVVCDYFQITPPIFMQSFENGIKELASYFKRLIYMPALSNIQKYHPLAFEKDFSNVSLLIDTFEIEIQKPSSKKSQAQTWSKNKNAHTLKHLIACTPNGWVAYVSKGFGGGITDKLLVENSGFIKWISKDKVIIADRAFDGIESLLLVKNVKLFLPPRIVTTTEIKEEDGVDRKAITKLLFHIKKAVKRIRSFKILKPFYVVTTQYVKYLDNIVFTACGMHNFGNEIINA